MKTRMFKILFCSLLLCMFQNVQAKRQIFVSTKGSDTNDGSLQRPLKSIQTAIRQAGLSADSVQIFLREGIYEQDKTLEITNREKPTFLHLLPYASEKVIISGGKTISAKQLKKIADKKISERIQSHLRDSIKEIDFKALGLTLSDLRASGFGRPSSESWCELFINEEPMQLSRWPNDSMSPIGKVIVAGTGESLKESDLPVFTYMDNRPSSWSKATDFWISGYFAHGYADDMIRVQKIDTVAKTIHTAQQTVYGFMDNAPWRAWFALNLPEEIDRPGEYVIDAKLGKIYIYPPQKKISSINLSYLKEALIAIENNSNVIIEDITIEYGRNMGVYMENTHNVMIKGCTIRNLGGVGICIGRGSETKDAITLKPHAAEAGGEPVSRKIGDLLGKVYQEILFNRNAGTNNGVKDCRIYQVGAGGVSLGGGDRASLTPAGNYVENCRIHDYNRVEKSYRPGIWIDGVGNHVTQCDIFNAPSMAILFHGNNHVIEYCKITNVCREVDDQGAIYYGRDPSERGNVIRYNYFHELSPRHRVTATYHDDGACGAKVYGNIYFRAGSLPVLIGGGSDIHYTNNIFIETPLAIHLDDRLNGWAKGMLEPGGIFDVRLKKVNYTQPPYSTAYPELVNFWNEDPGTPKRNEIRGNLFFKVGNVLSGKSKWGEFINNWITSSDPGFIDVNDPLKGFKPDAQVFENIPNFPQLPFDKIGCKL